MYISKINQDRIITMKYKIVISETKEGKPEYQVSDGDPYDGSKNKKERTHSYDFIDLNEAMDCLNKLNNKF